MARKVGKDGKREKGSMVSVSSRGKTNDQFSLLPRKVNKLTLKGKYIRKYKSMSEASIKTNIHVSSISRCCRDEIETAGGFKWEYNNSDLKLKIDPLDAQLDFL